MLNLGLINTVSYSHEDVLKAETDCLYAQMEYNRTLFDAIATAQNIYNFNEIISSLKKHSSSECFMFAEDLLGFRPSLESDDTNTEKKKSVTRKVIDAFKKWWITFTKFVGRCYYAAKDKIKQALKHIPLIKELFKREFEYKTYFSTKTLKQLNERLRIIIDSKGVTEVSRIEIYKRFVNTPVDMSLDGSHSATGRINIGLEKELTEWLKEANEAQLNLTKVMSDPPDWASLVDTIALSEHKAISEFQTVVHQTQKALYKDINRVTAKITAHNKEMYRRAYVHSKTEID